VVEDRARTRKLLTPDQIAEAREFVARIDRDIAARKSLTPRCQTCGSPVRERHTDAAERSIADTD
jgi:hypothetical protein